jgi:hypothetical protein
MRTSKLYNIFNTKVNNMQFKVFCLESLGSLNPVHAGGGLIETSQIENKYK